MAENFRIFATTDIGREALDRLRERGWEVDVYDHLQPPPRKLLLEKVASGLDALNTTPRARIAAEAFAAHLQVENGAVSRAKAAGALVLGKTVTTEFACAEPGATTNPWDPNHTPGGSSQGWRQCRLW